MESFTDKPDFSSATEHINKIREQNQLRYTMEKYDYEENLVSSSIAEAYKLLGVDHENGGFVHELKLAEQNLYWAKRYAEDGDFGHAVECLCFAQVQVRRAREGAGCPQREYPGAPEF